MDTFLHFLAAFIPLASGDTAVTAPTNSTWFPTSWLLMIPVLLLWVMLFPDRNKKQDEPKHVVNKNDRVVTVGGIHGVVVIASSDSEEVVIRVDEHTGTRLRINRTAIAQVLAGDEESEKS